MTAMTRRQFLRTSGATVAVLALASLKSAPEVGAWKATGSETSYGDWRDVYTEKWTWDRVVRCSHTRTNCLSACAWDVYVKDGIVWREEQAQTYDHGGRAGTPDFFPRGCQKGACYSDLMTSAARLRYPLERVGPRGSGRWKRITWDGAFDRVADAIIDAAVTHGPETVIYDEGTTNLDFGPGTAAEFRMANVIGATVLESWSGVGDMPMGCVQTWGMFNCEGTSDDWFRSDYIVIWSANPVYTRIPDMHFITGARYRGAKVVVIAPDYNATVVHSDLWLHPRVESDIALALAMAQVIVGEELLDTDYVREQTDLPFLVRSDTGRFLRQSDVEKNGHDDVFYLWDEARDRLALAPGSQGRKSPSLVLGKIRPALEGTRQVRLADKTQVEVQPMFELLRRQLDSDYTPERASELTGVGADLIRQVAREMAQAGAAMIFASWGTCKHYHSDLMHRSMALLMALTGNQGKAGGGLRIGAWWGMSGFERFSQMIEIPWWQNLLMRFMGRPPVREMEKFITKHSNSRPFTPLIPWLCVHAGYDKTMGKSTYNDPAAPASLSDALDEAIDQNWIPVYPRPGKDPKVFLFSAPNPLRRWPTPQVALENLWPKLDLIVNVNFQMSTTGLQSDVLLPAAGYYEKRGIKYSQSYLPYLVLDDKAVDPLGESRGEWWIFGELTRRIQERAKSRGVDKVRDPFGNTVDLTRAFARWSEGGTYDPSDDRPAIDHIFEHSEICEETTWDEAIGRGLIPVRKNGTYSQANAICSDADFERPVYPNAWQVEQKEAWPTLTGRQQFYLDHDWYLRAGEALPVHKEPPMVGGDFPLRLTGGHTRWSIHAIWRMHALMLRLQRGEPVIYVNDADARARRIGEGDRVRVFNDEGAFVCSVKPSPAVQPGQAIIYHAWEPCQFPGHRGQAEPVASPWKALHVVGGYGQLHYRVHYAAPSHGPRGTCIEIERV